MRHLVRNVPRRGVFLVLLSVPHSIPPLILVLRDQSWQVRAGLSSGRLPYTPLNITRRGVFLVLPAVPLRGQRASVAPSCFRGRPGSRKLAPFSVRSVEPVRNGADGINFDVVRVQNLELDEIVGIARGAGGAAVICMNTS